MSEATDETTPRPWKASELTCGIRAGTTPIAMVTYGNLETRLANRELIVKAVNSHDAYAARIKELEEALRACHKEATDPPRGRRETWFRNSWIADICEKVLHTNNVDAPVETKPQDEMTQEMEDHLLRLRADDAFKAANPLTAAINPEETKPSQGDER